MHARVYICIYVCMVDMCGFYVVFVDFFFFFNVYHTLTMSAFIDPASR